MTRTGDSKFVGSIPEIYETHLVPLIFEPYAEDLAKRLVIRPPSRVLEVAAGTGVVTRALARTLPASTTIVATDLNPAMLDRAAVVGTVRPVGWRQADALDLPFEDRSFDAVVCQFGVMFFPDKPRAFSEARRVLAPGGMFLLNVWDRIEDNEFADVITLRLGELFPSDPPLFMARTPHGYHDPDEVVRDLAAGGFTATPAVEVLAARSRAATARGPALAYCQGTILRTEIEARGGDIEEATEATTRAVAERFGDGPVDGKIQALVVTVER